MKKSWALPNILRIRTLNLLYYKKVFKICRKTLCRAYSVLIYGVQAEVSPFILCQLISQTIVFMRH